jgi:multidrug efflux pump subunit AcrA (membrane-fusion protein)
VDIAIKKKHPVIRYRYYIAGGAVFLAFLVYVIVVSAGPRQLRYDADKLTIAEVQQGKFLEYLDVEGIVQPILTVKLNALETGTVARIVAEDGDMLASGDTILILQNPELTRIIEDERDELEKQRIAFSEREIQMRRKTSELKRQTIETAYKLRRIGQQYELSRTEYEMGASSKAQLDLSRDEYEFNRDNTAMLMDELRHDSLMNVIQTSLMQNDFRREEKRFERSRQRLDELTVRAPIAGQLSFVSVIAGERVPAGSSIGELKVVDQFKINTRISEYYIDRITIGLPATIVYQNRKFPLRIGKINPEVKERQFAVDLVLLDETPENIRIGKNYRIQIELGQPEDALIIPKGSFFQQTGGQWIFLLNEAGDKARKANISIGRQNPQQYEVMDGLKPGEHVIVSGYDNFGDAEEIVLKAPSQ